MARTLSLTRRTLLGSCAALIASRAAAAADMAYRNTRVPMEDRVRDLLARMTLEEKVAQVRSMWMSKSRLLDGDVFSPEKAAAAIADGIGQIGMPHDTIGSARMPRTIWATRKEAVDFVNGVQRFLLEKTRLGIPALFHDEAAHGYVADGATIFPSPPALGSTWDPALVERVFTVAGREARLGGATIVLAPVIDLMREPRWGRAGETFSEDPHLTAQMGIAAVRGLQGRTRPLARDRVFVTLKHFVHGSPENGVNIAPADTSERNLRENYLVPFAEVIKATNPAAIMPSYNEVNGVPAHASHELLTVTGRERLGFTGAYLSDYGGVTNLVTDHHVATDTGEAAILALKAGVDAELPDGEAFARLPALIRAGRVSATLLDAAVARILTLKFEAGLFENPYADVRLATRGTNMAADIALARTAAQKGIVLLRNDGVLPLDPRKKTRLAVIGPNAVEPMFGGYSGINANAVGILDGLMAAGTALSIEYAEGVRLTDAETGPSVLGPFAALAGPAVIRTSHADNAERIRRAVELAQRSDIVLLVLGDNATITREAVLNIRPGDRDTLGLYGDQDELVEAMLALGKPVVALLLNGRPLAVTRLAEKANALLEGWYLGQEGGNAFADILFGKVSPGGKLTVSIPRAVGDLPVFYNRHPSARARPYIEGDPAPLYPFGHGLSYTTFDMSPPRVGSAEVRSGDGTTVEVEVTNSGNHVGDEVVQLYIRDEVSSVPRPVMELKGFERVTLKPGEKRVVRFTITPDMLAFWDIDMKWTVEPGLFTISAGASSATLKSTKLRVL
ncbi:glycoside hydrolase family 3 C-terminal domain-containing protein [Novosphingobium sp. G106]|uniref:glycoside hydrolase family 3 N-terminal domain-containing protein n=1 Tax=Novosphingobium sp. G106 TaxID=2849500 RepID=UPI001C2D38F6|nr:glycoside hydrolase family 3 N-terminal domain-containing protein [Novosphingobium sp. G106]MBV1687778.1 glycoside hydrolase family 3 C-terminal domain-containing protein [Novosphingobium sp. G106]